jgi:predicted AlkP superfamily phosphohydrolase/phosphomutase
MGRILIVGIDGGTFDLIKPWSRQGKLPHLTRLMREGAHGELESTMPPMSFPAWNSFMTGKNPGKHGVFDFTRRTGDGYEVEFINGSYRKAGTLWKILSDAHKKAAVIGVPATYPPEPIDGVMISGFDTPGGVASRDSIHPPELYDEIVRNVGEYIVSTNLDAFGHRQPDRALKAVLNTLQRKGETAKYLYQKEAWDFFMVLFGETDLAGHYFWKYHDPDSPFSRNGGGCRAIGDPILQVYQKVDAILGELLGLARADTTVFVISDHGHGGCGDKAIYLNRWLESQGFLAFRSANGNGGSPLSAVDGLRRASTALFKYAKIMGLKFVPPKLKARIFRGTNIANKMESWLRFGLIDWKKTRAFSEETPYYPTIWLNRKDRESEGIVEADFEYETLRDEIIDRLYAWEDPETGKSVVSRVFKREELYRGPHADEAPDLVIDWALDRGYSYLSRSSSVDGSREVLARVKARHLEHLKSGSHRSNGVLIARGKPIARPRQIRGASLMDLAPTVLYLLGLPIPQDMDGEVLTEAVAENFRSKHPVMSSGASAESDRPSVGYSREEAAIIKDRLQGIGYIE